MTKTWSFSALKDVVLSIRTRTELLPESLKAANALVKSAESFWASCGEPFLTPISTDSWTFSSLTVNRDSAASPPLNRLLGTQSAREYPSVNSLLNRSSDGWSDSFFRLKLTAV
jgi:hypothetical protein